MAGLLTGIYAGRESLITHGTALSNVADNIANNNTVAYKSSRIEFGDLLAESVGSLYGAPLSTGNGVTADGQTTFHSIQGALEFTGRELDVAVQGRGYFVLSDGVDFRYTRAGNFITDLEGNLQAQTGESVLGFTPESPDVAVPLSLSTAGGDAEATTFVNIVGNLAANAPLQDQLPADFDNYLDLNEATSFRSSIRVVDSLGTQQEVSLHYFHTAAGEWEVRAYVDSGDVGDDVGTPTQVGVVNLEFDGQGVLQNPDQAVLQINAPWGNGADAAEIAVSLNFTGFSGSSSVRGINSDGVIAGDIEAIKFTTNGTVIAVLSNGQETSIGQLAIASFRNPNGLERIGSNTFIDTPSTGGPDIGRAQEIGRGTVNGGALESSIVDPATEFVSMIRYQRGYQASSSVIQTLDRMLETTINIA